MVAPTFGSAFWTFHTSRPVAAQRPGRERPRGPQILDVVLGDLVQRAEPSGRIVLPWHHPLLVIGLQAKEFGVRVRNRRGHNENETSDRDTAPHLSAPYSETGALP